MAFSTNQRVSHVLVRVDRDKKKRKIKLRRERGEKCVYSSGSCFFLFEFLLVLLLLLTYNARQANVGVYKHWSFYLSINHSLVLGLSNQYVNNIFISKVIFTLIASWTCFAENGRECYLFSAHWLQAWFILDMSVLLLPTIG